MGMQWYCGLVLLGWVALLGCVHGEPLEDLVTNLPGQPKVDFRQFAGYIDVDKKTGKSLFYYFVEAPVDARKKPLTLWLNGGPGCSSIGGGAFTEFGPFRVRGDGRALVINPQSWNKVSNLLFVESPVGVGWSYSNTSSDYIRGDDATARDMQIFLRKWFDKYPEYRSSSLFLTGESYAGHYIPQLANVLVDYNRHSNDFKFNIKGVAIGNPLLKLETDRLATYDFYWSHGMISDETLRAVIKECNFENETLRDGFLQNGTLSETRACVEAQTVAFDEYGARNIDHYHVLLDRCYPSLVHQELRLRKFATKISIGVDVCIEYERSLYLNLPQVQQALHANRTKLPYAWSICDFTRIKYSEYDTKRNMMPLLKRIIRNHIPLWVYSGDQDSVIPLLGTRALMKKLANDLNLNVTVPYGIWIHKKQVGGWFIEYGNILTYATVRGGAHMVPYSQPGRAFELFSSFVRGRRLPNKILIS